MWTYWWVHIAEPWITLNNWKKIGNLSLVDLWMCAWLYGKQWSSWISPALPLAWSPMMSPFAESPFGWITGLQVHAGVTEATNQAEFLFLWDNLLRLRPWLSRLSRKGLIQDNAPGHARAHDVWQRGFQGQHEGVCITSTKWVCRGQRGAPSQFLYLCLSDSCLITQIMTPLYRKSQSRIKLIAFSN